MPFVVHNAQGQITGFCAHRQPDAREEVVESQPDYVAFFAQKDRAVLSSAVNAERDRRIAAGFVFRGVLFQCRRDDQINISGAGILASLAIGAGAQPGDLRWHGGDTDFVWIAMDNSLVPMDAPTVIEFGRAAAAWKSAHVFAGRALKDVEAVPSNFADDASWPSNEV